MKSNEQSYIGEEEHKLELLKVITYSTTHISASNNENFA